MQYVWPSSGLITILVMTLWLLQGATVYFSDIADFNEICIDSEPLEVVAVLNTVYNLIDAHIDVYDVYKVRKITND